MRYLIIMTLLTLTACFKKKEPEVPHKIPEFHLIELDDEDLEDLPEAGDTGS